MFSKPAAKIASDPVTDEDVPSLTPGKARAEAIKRLQIGGSGLFAVILLVALANIIRDRAEESEKTTVPEAVATMGVDPAPAPNKDPLADAGVVPELPSAPAPQSAGGSRGDDDPASKP